MLVGEITNFFPAICIGFMKLSFGSKFVSMGYCERLCVRFVLGERF